MNESEARSRCWLEVDLDAIKSNYRSAVRITRGTTTVIPVLKANAYGMGASAVAQALKEEGARVFAVAAPNEAEQIARRVSDIDILTMGAVGEDVARRLIRQGQLLTMYSAENGRMISKIAGELGIQARVHIKIDTGLHRIGFDCETAVAEITAIVKEGNIRAEGLFTHLAIHSEAADRAQMRKLDDVRTGLLEHGIKVEMIHAMDSIGMVRYAGTTENLNAVRIGAWMYGVEPSNDNGYQPASAARFCARVSQVRKVHAGELIGYDDDSPLTRDSIIATVTAGYIDGTPRVGRNWEVEINGSRVPVIGIACMDQLMCDVTDIGEVREGDIVVFNGGLIGNEEYSRMGAFNHNEAWARIGRRVPRVYLENGAVKRIESEMEL